MSLIGHGFRRLLRYDYAWGLLPPIMGIGPILVAIGLLPGATVDRGGCNGAAAFFGLRGARGLLGKDTNGDMP